MSTFKPNRVDQVDINIPLNQHDGDIPNLKPYKITQIKKFFSLSVNEEKLSEYKVSHYKVVNLGLSKVKLEDGKLISFPEQIKLTLYGTNAIINFNLLELGSCFSLKFYDENVWGNLNPCYFDDYAGKTSGIRKFSSKSYDEVFTFINESVESGKIFTVK